jgi:hypothetical protein
MQLAMEETVELSVYAFPSAEGLVEDAIMCRYSNRLVALCAVLSGSRDTNVHTLACTADPACMLLDNFTGTAVRVKSMPAFSMQDMEVLTCCCRLQDNPTPYEFPISVLGARPQVAVKLDTLPSAEASEGIAGSQHAAVQRRTSDAGGNGKAAAKGAVGKGAKVQADYTIKFDRLLLNKRDTQAFTISNMGVLPFKWRLAGVAQLPPEFKVYPSEGELAARSKVQVTVEFNALKKQELHELVTLEVRLTHNAT